MPLVALKQGGKFQCSPQAENTRPLRSKALIFLAAVSHLSHVLCAVLYRIINSFFQLLTFKNQLLIPASNCHMHMYAEKECHTDSPHPTTIIRTRISAGGHA